MDFLRRLLLVAVFQCLTFITAEALQYEVTTILRLIDFPCPPKSTYQEAKCTKICQCRYKVCGQKFLAFPSHLCVCDEGLVLGPDGCVPPSECPPFDPILEEVCRILSLK
ncbi:hypothetical protein GDO81_022884 [Engystomops pustulosus]|uniref:Uncharacterized protein n=1 Tax=Engystomops pustulosus TaxID=76066 RepID=A0AAV6ZAF8_ENGPU|nr:hypothetical protein GDO81_022884 [Engystomops pustulosus]KAG8544231.1 hypothetical protein GDO81_022884 [Engystomops pustulosus]